MTHADASETAQQLIGANQYRPCSVLGQDIGRIIGIDDRIAWPGDDVVGLSPNTDFLPLYPDASD